MSLQPGTYRITELALLAGVTRTTVDKWETRYSLVKTLVEHENREVGAYQLTVENIDRLSREYPRINNVVDDTLSTQSSTSRELEMLREFQTTQIEELKSKNLSLETEISQLRKLLSESQMRCSKMEGLLENHQNRLSDKDAIIAAKEQALNAANAAVLLLDERKHPAIETDLSMQNSDENKKGWLQKLLGR